MDLQYYIQKLENSKIYKDFILENPEAYFTGGFFILDFEGNFKGDEQNLDFFSPKDKNFYVFYMENDEFKIKHFEKLENENQKPEKIDKDINFELEDVYELLAKRIKEEKITNKLQKILFSIQKIEEKIHLVGSVFTSGFGIIHFSILLENMEIVNFEKKGFMDFIRFIKKE